MTVTGSKPVFPVQVAQGELGGYKVSYGRNMFNLVKLQGWGMLSILIVLMVSYVKTSRSVCFKYVLFIICQLCLDKACFTCFKKMTHIANTRPPPLHV